MNRSGPGHRPDSSRSIAAKSSAPSGMSTLISPTPRCTIDHDAEDTGICVIRRPVRTSPTMMVRVTSAPHQYAGAREDVRVAADVEPRGRKNNSTDDLRAATGHTRDVSTLSLIHI